MDERTSKLITYHVATGMSVVYWFKISLRLLKLKHARYAIVMILSAYEKPK